MAIYIRDKQGDLTALNIPAIKGEDGITPNISIGTVTTLEAGEQATVTREGTKENPIFNFGIPKGESGVNSSGSNNLFIDDNTISTEKTWSSFKTEDFVLNNVGAIWKEINGEQMVIDSTMDGFLREVEILGNTVQNEQDLSNIQHLGVWNAEKQGYEIEIVVSNSSSKDVLNYQEFRTTIVLPCQLMKIDKIADKLYWDKNKGIYVIEKNIKTTNLPAIENVTNSIIDGDKGGKWAKTYYNNDYKKWEDAFLGIESIQANLHAKYDLMKIPGVRSMSNYINQWLNVNERGKLFSSNHINQNTPNASISVIFRNTDLTNVEEMNNWVMSFSKKVAYYRLSAPQIIDTDIREEIKLPTFINNTYVTVNGGIQGSIKAKAPVDGGKVIGVLQEENIKLKEINEVQDELINTTMLATNEMYMMLEPLLTNMLIDGETISSLVNMYVAMIKRGLLKTIDEVPEKYRNLVKKNI